MHIEFILNENENHPYGGGAMYRWCSALASTTTIPREPAILATLASSGQVNGIGLSQLSDRIAWAAGRAVAIPAARDLRHRLLPEQLVGDDVSLDLNRSTANGPDQHITQMTFNRVFS